MPYNRNVEQWSAPFSSVQFNFAGLDNSFLDEGWWDSYVFTRTNFLHTIDLDTSPHVILIPNFLYGENFGYVRSFFEVHDI